MYVCGSKNWMPGLRELRAYEHREQAAGEEEEDRRREVLDADHLVVGVDAEVVLPRARAVTRVILGPRRAAERVVRPVVERADAGEEADRAPRRGTRRARSAASPRSAASCPTSAAPRRSRARSPAKRTVIHAARIQPAPSRSRRAVPCWTGGVAVHVVVGGRCGHRASHPFLLDWIRYWTSASSCAFGRLENGGITFFGKPGCVYAFGSVIDVLMNCSSGCFAWAAHCGSLSRSGPTFPVAPAAVSVWQEPHGLVLEDGGAGDGGVRRRRRLRLSLQPLVEGRRRHDDRRRAHRRVAEAAELGADDRDTCRSCRA